MVASHSNWIDLFHDQACGPLRPRVSYRFKPLQVVFMIAVAMGQEIDQ
ncbi:hypothetical protein X743_32875 [Mesorhizobium sp. LNHC252B00]|nr:hypothetical protein X743_32875 [Mesorhizobium sp. LNHC252B00]